MTFLLPEIGFILLQNFYLNFGVFSCARNSGKHNLIIFNEISTVKECKSHFISEEMRL